MTKKELTKRIEFLVKECTETLNTKCEKISLEEFQLRSKLKITIRFGKC